MMISKNPNLTDYSEDASLPAHHRRGCNFWISLIPATKYLKLSTTTASSPNLTDSEHDLLPTPIQFQCVSMFWDSIHKFATKHFKRSTTTTTRSDPSSTNPNINIERSVTSSTNPNIIIDSLPTLPFDLITEILSRLPVKLLLQLRCVCKSWNSLISNDPNFAKKQLTHSATHSIYSLGFSYPGCLTIYPPNFFFNTAVSTNVKRLSCFLHNCCSRREIVGSCNGILCFAYKEFVQLWNPYIRKLKELPLLPNPAGYPKMAYGFGYHSVADNYKVVVVLWNACNPSQKTQVKVNTLGTKFWKNIDEFPFGIVPDHKSGKYVTGTINWLASSLRRAKSYPRSIVSLDLGNESYQEVLQPDYGEVQIKSLTLDVMRDCLCMIAHHDVGHDVWLMKEYGSKESWTKLFTISYMQNPIPSVLFFLTKVVYVFEDGQVLLQCKMTGCCTQLIVYDPRIGTFKFVTFPKSFYDARSGMLDVSKYGGPEACIESLISPCS